MKKYLIFTFREFLGLNSDYESLLTNQTEILEKLEKLESTNNLLIENQKESYLDYLTLKNFLILLLIFSIIGSGFWLYNSDFFSNSILESIKSLGNVSKDFHTINHQAVLDALKKLNENTVNLNKEEVKLLLEIKNLILKNGIDRNTNLDKPLDLNSRFTLGNPITKLGENIAD